MAKARKASVTQSKLGMILYGEQFTGKSTMDMQLAYFKRPDGKPFRVLYLDPETGSIDDYLGELEANGVDLNNIYIVYTQSLGEVRQYIAKVKNGEDFYELDDDGDETDEIVLDADGEPFRADAIVVDGTSILNLTTKQGLIEFSKKRNKVKADKDGLVGDARLVKIEGAGMELKDYQTINFKGQDLILDLMASGVHYIATARETVTPLVFPVVSLAYQVKFLFVEALCLYHDKYLFPILSLQLLFLYVHNKTSPLAL